ncbi:receptor-transporting protein 3-like [Pagrus major]|uniref:receptor-transporting protein 3-like n=1 Tax=Pagrus major TaxID=143350 RepID=UPI003CC8CE36
MALTDWTSIFMDWATNLEQRDSWRLEFDDTIVPKSPNPGWKEYIKKTVGWFKCTKCGRSWPSNRVMVVFHMRLECGQGVVKVRRFRQNCKRCTSAPMEKPEIDHDDINILMENLVKKIRIKCYHEDLHSGSWSSVNVDVRGPHEPDHCEACMFGICQRDEATNNPSASYY